MSKNPFIIISPIQFTTTSVIYDCNIYCNNFLIAICKFVIYLTIRYTIVFTIAKGLYSHV